MLIQLEPPPLPKARRKRTNAGVSIENNPFGCSNRNGNPKGTTLELDLAMDMDRYPMTLGPGSTRLGSESEKNRNIAQDSIDLGLELVSSPACMPVPAALPVPLSLRVSAEEGSRGRVDSGDSSEALGDKEKQKERDKEKIQIYYLGSSSSVSTGSPSSPFERYGMETETDPSLPDTPYLNTHLHPSIICANTDTVAFAHTQVRKRSSFFGWEFAWDQEALERADDAGKLRNGGGSPICWKSDGNVNDKLPSNHIYTSKKIQPLLIVDDEILMDIGEDQESFGHLPSLSRPHSLSSVEVGGRVKRGMSWRSSVCGVVGVGGEKAKRKNMLSLGIGIQPLRLSRSFGGSRGSGAGNSKGMGHRTVFSGDVGTMCGLSLKRKVLFGGQGSPLHVVEQGKGDGDVTMMATIVAITTPKRLKKKTKPGHSTAGVAGTSPSVESEMGKRNSKSNIRHHGSTRPCWVPTIQIASGISSRCLDLCSVIK